MDTQLEQTNFGTLPLNEPTTPGHVKTMIEIIKQYKRNHYGYQLPYAISQSIHQFHDTWNWTHNWKDIQFAKFDKTITDVSLELEPEHFTWMLHCAYNLILHDAICSMLFNDEQEINPKILFNLYQAKLSYEKQNAQDSYRRYGMKHVLEGWVNFVELRGIITGYFAHRFNDVKRFLQRKLRKLTVS